MMESPDEGLLVIFLTKRASERPTDGASHHTSSRPGQEAVTQNEAVFDNVLTIRLCGDRASAALALAASWLAFKGSLDRLHWLAGGLGRLVARSLGQSVCLPAQ